MPGHDGLMETVAARVDRAIGGLDRRDFLPTGQHRFAAVDLPLPIGHGATCSQPSTVVRMLELLDARPGHRVLDVGCGSGWTTALLHRLVAPGGSVRGVELEPALVETGTANLRRAGVVGPTIEAARPGVLGSPEAGPFDRILVSAEADDLPEQLADQLAPGGRMVIPVAGTLVVVDDADGVRTRRAEGSYRFVPLRSEPGPL